MIREQSSASNQSHNVKNFTTTTTTTAAAAAATTVTTTTTTTTCLVAAYARCDSLVLFCFFSSMLSLGHLHMERQINLKSLK